jgi:uncharacterized OB-fold protein
MAIKRADFPLPDIDDPLTAEFFAGAARGELVIPRCDTCNKYVWYPRDACPHDGGALTWTRVSGNGTLFSWAVVQRAFLPAFTDRVPFVTALVAIDEDPAVRIVAYIVDAEPNALRVDQPVRVDFRPLAFATVPDRAVAVPMFRPVEGGAR